MDLGQNFSDLISEFVNDLMDAIMGMVQELLDSIFGLSDDAE